MKSKAIHMHIWSFPQADRAALGRSSIRWQSGIRHILTTLLWLGGLTVSLAQDTPEPLRGYSNFEQFEARLKKLESPRATLKSLGETAAKRPLWLLTVADDPQTVRPAILVVGNVVAPHVVGRELATRMAEQILQSADSDPAIKDLLARFTLYFIPSPTPDATEKNFRFPVQESVGNSTPTDDDRDFETGEDGPLDLNQDGWVTQLRVKQQFGTHRTHPQDPRVLIPIDVAKREVGEFHVWPEAKDPDKDESLGEDASAGVVFNRNFTFNYPFFGKGAGPHQVSEAESRIMADFLFDHPNIAVVLCFSTDDNLFHPWKASSGTDSARIKTKVLSADQKFLDSFAESFRKLHGGKSAPTPSAGEGSFSEFSYFHFGRWTFASRGWWVPPLESTKTDTKTKESSSSTENKEPSSPDKAAGSTPETTSESNTAAEAKPANGDTTARPASNATLDKDDKRGAEELAALAWFESQGINGFVNWQKIDHPDLPGKQVEVGGFKPLVLLNPPEKLIQALVQPHVSFLNELARNWPKLDIQEVEAVDRGNGLFDIRCKVVNTASLPTMPEMGSVNRQWYPAQVKLIGAEGAKMIEGSLRTAVGRLSENGGSKELHWVVLIDKSTKPTFKIQISAPTLHSIESVVKPIQP